MKQALTGLLKGRGAIDSAYIAPWAPAYNARANGLPSSPRAGGVRS